jgi:DNA processing protein
MAGLSHAVLVIEGERDSGTLITARLAVEYNRDVLAIPGSIFSDASEGPLSLIKRGAVPICNENDLFQALGFDISSKLEDSAPENEKYKRCSEEELSVLKLLDYAKSRDDLLASSGLPISKLQIVLSMLEIRGLIIEEYGLIRKTNSISMK